MILHEGLFWLHIVAIIFAVAIGLFLPLSTVALLIVAHRIHVFLFKGCIISRLQQKIGALPANVDFIQLAFERLVAKKLSPQHSKVADYALGFTVLTVALIRYAI